jgi:hypothetical protein
MISIYAKLPLHCGSLVIAISENPWAKGSAPGTVLCDKWGLTFSKLAILSRTGTNLLAISSSHAWRSSPEVPADNKRIANDLVAVNEELKDEWGGVLGEL